MVCPPEVRLTFSQLAAVAVARRFALVRALATRRQTVSELAEATGIAKSTAHVHLRVLRRHGLVSRHEDGRVWVYYELTPVGRSIATMDPLRLVVPLGAAASLVFGGAAAVAWSLLWRPAEDLPWGVPPIGAPPEPATPEIGLPIVGAGLILVGVASAAWWWRRARRELAARSRQFG